MNTDEIMAERRRIGAWLAQHARRSRPETAGTLLAAANLIATGSYTQLLVTPPSRGSTALVGGASGAQVVPGLRIALALVQHVAIEGFAGNESFALRIVEQGIQDRLALAELRPE